MRVAGIPAVGGLDRRKFGECWRKAVDGVVGFLRIGDVPLLAVHAQIAAERAAPADGNTVAEDLGAGRFADNGVVRLHAALFQNLDYVPGTVLGNTFFIAGDQKRDAAVDRALS